MLSALVMAGVLLASTPPDGQTFLNEYLAHLLKGQTIKVEEAKEGMKIPLHSLIITSPLSGVVEDSTSGRVENLQPDGFVTVTWKLKDVNEKFVTFLLQEYTAVRMFHPFADRGIEAILKEDSLAIKLHEGMLLHLRNDTPFFPNAKSFVSEDVFGTVTEVQGKVFVSMDTGVIKTKLSTIWSDSLLCKRSIPRCVLGDTCIQAPNGMYVMTARKLKGVSCALRCIWGETCIKKPDGSVEILAIAISSPPEYYLPRVEKLSK